MSSGTVSRAPVSAFIAIGANLGHPAETVSQAMIEMDRIPGVSVRSRSSLYGTAPIDSSGPDYVNAVVEVSTSLTAPALLAQLQTLENLAGRARPYWNAPRTLDLDILLFGSATMASETLVVPHPRMTERAFVLVPLAEIAPLAVTDAQLDAVRTQQIARLASTGVTSGAY